MKNEIKIKIQLKAIHCIGVQTNPVLEKTLVLIYKYEDEPIISKFNTYIIKGAKTEYRICGDELYSIGTGRSREYRIVEIENIV